MTTTTNIPKDFPFHADEAERKAIIDWMKTRRVGGAPDPGVRGFRLRV